MQRRIVPRLNIYLGGNEGFATDWQLLHATPTPADGHEADTRDSHIDESPADERWRPTLIRLSPA